MRVLHVLPTTDPSYGGPVGAVAAYVRVLRQLGVQVEVFPGEPLTPERVGPGFWPGRRGISRLLDSVRRADLVHVHGLWTLPTSFAAAAAARSRRPFVLTLHGMLDPRSRRRSRYKKALYYAAIERHTLRNAAAIHALTERERSQALEFGLRSPIFVLPNGADCAAFAALPGRELLDEWLPQLRHRLVVLFLGRIHPIKGLDLLVPAVAEAREREPRLHLVIAGPGDSTYVDAVQQLVRRCGQEEAVTFTGRVRGEEKRRLLGGSDLFALTSHQEGDSLAIKEALAASLPSVIARDCVPPEVIEEEAACLVDRRVDAIAAAISGLAADSERRHELARRGRVLMERSFDWSHIVRRLLQVYQEVLEEPRRRTSSPGR